jgi:integrase/recombinase XerC
LRTSAISDTSRRQTLRAYVSDLAQFRGWLIEHRGEPLPGPDSIDALAIRGFVASLHNDGLAKSSVARKLSAVRSYLKHAVRLGVIDASPAEGIPTPKRPKLLPKKPHGRRGVHAARHDRR